MLNVSCITSSMNFLLTRNDEPWLWNRRLAHIHMHHLNRLASKELVIGLPKLKFERDMDLFRPSRTMSLRGNYYSLVVVDDYSCFTWALFIATKYEAYHAFKGFTKVIQNEKNCGISAIKLDHGGEFQNEKVDKFCSKFGIKHNFSAPRTPQ